MDIPRLQQAIARLNERTDQITENVRAIEECLADAQIGHYASVLVDANSIVDDRGQDHGSHVRCLTYDKVGSKWRVCVEHSTDMAPEQREIKPWAECSRSEKLETIGKLDKLIDELASQIEQKSSLAENAAQSTAGILKSLRDSIPSLQNPFGLPTASENEGR